MRRSVSSPSSSNVALPLLERPAPIVIDYRWGSMGSNETATATTRPGNYVATALFLAAAAAPGDKTCAVARQRRGEELARAAICARGCPSSRNRCILTHSDTTIAAAFGTHTACR